MREVERGYGGVGESDVLGCSERGLKLKCMFSLEGKMSNRSCVHFM